ncbi:MAG: FKBP-type peptidyl-prolyl cis-trans isomerase [Paludibacteraceae bacterium]|nr:FKBP-type peptidyl-prolyl cis-trans isomerase [Paludibacteraceae bacterium]
MRARIVIYVLTFIALAGCGKIGPQLPHRIGESPEADSAELALLELNQQMAIAAEKQLLQYVQAQDEPYAVYEVDTWMHIIDRGDENAPTPQPNEEWTIAMRTYNMDGQLLVDSEGTYRIRKQELPIAVDINIKELHRGGKARLVVPWYAAYGMKGTEDIPPYENLIIDIELK